MSGPVSPWRDRWQKRYEQSAFPFGREPNAWLTGLERWLPRCGRALCLGEGEGRNAVWLARRGLTVTAVDFAPAALARAAALAAEAGVALTLVEADLSRWTPPAAAFDLVVLIFVQLSPEERLAAHRTAAAALAPGGLIVLEAFARGPALSCGPRGEDSRYTPEMLEADFAGLEILELMAGRTTLAEGEGHRGPASVVRLIARRPSLDPAAAGTR